MAWQVPWIIVWFVSWVGPYTSLPPLLPSDAQPDALIFNNISLDAVTPSDHPTNSPKTVYFNLEVVNSCVAPGGYPREAVLVRTICPPDEPTCNSRPQVPGPLVSGNKGDQFLIDVTNSLNDTSMMVGTTVHWHGIHQYGTSQMDGTDGTTQCAMGPGNTFQYSFTGKDQVGTFWYHSHFAVQYCDGLSGPLIIYDNDNDMRRYNYTVDDESTIITLMDWYHYPSVLTPRQIWPDSVLINGIGCYPNMPCGPPATIEVEEGTRYRFRLLNMACKEYYDFSIQGHELTVVEVEGTYVAPYTVTSIRIFAAQRYSFILDANQPLCDYTISAVPNVKDENISKDTAILRYKNGMKECPPPLFESENRPLNEACLRTDDTPDGILGAVSASYMVNMTKNGTNFDFLVDGFQYTPPTAPVLMQIMNGWLPDELEPYKSIIPLKKDEIIEVIFNIDSAGRPHPFHLHGHSFAVIKSADGVCPNPGPGKSIMRDTVNTGLNAATNGVTIRFLANNPGPWFLHCHNEWHLWTGMGLIFVEDYEGIKKQSYSDQLKGFCTYEPKYFPLPAVRTTAGPFTPPPTPTCTPPSF